MKLITNIEIENFRSIKKLEINDIKEHNSFFGSNNSGKSNILRALNLFFNNETDKDQELDFSEDFHQSKSKKKKEIKVCITFKLPENFKFKKNLNKTEEFILGKSKNDEIKIEKIFGRDYLIPEKITLNENELEDKDLRHIDNFLNLINFRYIPNRVLPIKILARESNALKKAISRKINRLRTDKKTINQASTDLATAVSKTSLGFIQPIAEEFKRLSNNSTAINLVTPSAVENLMAIAGFSFKTNNVDTRDVYQGSGVQSFLMFQVLHHIDKDYAQQFGWKQATIWAVEEPESSLHFDLQALLANFLSRKVTEKNSRLQFFCTTHASMFAQYSQKSILVRKPQIESVCEPMDSPKEIYKVTAKEGISEYTHPLLFFPNFNIVLCEGKTDVIFLRKVFELLNLDQSNIQITELAALESDPNLGGVDSILSYITKYKDMVKHRFETYNTKIIILLDWDIKQKQIKKIKKIEGVKIVQWPQDKVKKEVKSLKGIESLCPIRFIKQIYKNGRFQEVLIKDEKSGKYSYEKSNENKEQISEIKNQLSKKVKNDLTKKDVVSFEDFIREKVL